MSHEAIFASIDDAVARRRLRPLDVAFARFIAECDPHADDSVVLLAALTSRRLADGHPCLDLSNLPALFDESEWPSEWLSLLDNSKAATSITMADASGLPIAAPLVLDGKHLYLRRYWQYERQVAGAIALRIAEPFQWNELLPTTLREFFPEPASVDAPVDWQRVACAIASAGRFSVITGGPGTGKTTTVMRLLGLLQSLQLKSHARPLRIRLAAPTGKAAARLNASMAAQRASLSLTEEVRAALPQTVETLHRLLGARPDSRQFRYDRHHPLHVDVLVIDEASMIDLEMMAAVIDALPSHARLILLGDKDQLSSVEAGAVLGDLCRRAEGGYYSDATARWIEDVSGDDIAAYVHADNTPLDQRVTMLRLSHRFGSRSGIGRLASAVNAGNQSDVDALWSTPHADIAWIETETVADSFASLVIDGGAGHFLSAQDARSPNGYRHYLRRLSQRPVASAQESDYQQWAGEVLQAFGSFQLLCALRQGQRGAEGLNRRVASLLFDCGLIEADNGWYEGRPVMVTRNDYSLGLMNGDVGIALRRPGADGTPRLYVAFEMTTTGHADEGDGNKIRFVLPSRLSDVDTVYAMTVHKSQGSEFEHAALVLPQDAPAALSRELLYTGITRARRWFSLIATPESFRLAVMQGSRRYSGLTDRIGR